MGTAALTTRGFNENAFTEVGEIIADRLLYPDDSLIENKCKERVLTLCNRFPLYEGKLEASIKCLLIPRELKFSLSEQSFF